MTYDSSSSEEAGLLSLFRSPFLLPVVDFPWSVTSTSAAHSGAYGGQIRKRSANLGATDGSAHW